MGLSQKYEASFRTRNEEKSLAKAIMKNDLASLIFYQNDDRFFDTAPFLFYKVWILEEIF